MVLAALVNVIPAVRKTSQKVLDVFHRCCGVVSFLPAMLSVKVSMSSDSAKWSGTHIVIMMYAKENVYAASRYASRCVTPMILWYMRMRNMQE